MNEAERTREELLKELETQREHLVTLEAAGSASKAAEEQYRGLLDAAPDAMIIVNQDGQIVLINRQTETLFGYARDEIIDQAVERLVPERFRNQHPIYRTAYFATPSFRPMGAGIELYGLHKDGSEFPVEISLSPFTTPAGVLVTSAIRDITDRKKMEEDLQRSAVSRDLVGQMLRDLRAIGALSEGAMHRAGQALVTSMEAQTLPQALETFTSMGLGALALAEADEALRRWTFMGHDLMEVNKDEGMPTCHYTRGFLHGVVQQIAGDVRVADTEVACQSMAHATCCFVVQVMGT